MCNKLDCDKHFTMYTILKSSHSHIKEITLYNKYYTLLSTSHNSIKLRKAEFGAKFETSIHPETTAKLSPEIICSTTTNMYIYVMLIGATQEIFNPTQSNWKNTIQVNPTEGLNFGISFLLWLLNRSIYIYHTEIYFSGTNYL